MSYSNARVLIQRLLKNKREHIFYNENHYLHSKPKLLFKSYSSSNTTRTSSTNTSDGQKRLVRREPGKVVLGFIPQEFFTAFYKKTGVLGFPTFIFTFSTYLISKEIYVLEHEFYNGLSLAILCVFAVKKAGPILAKNLDQEIDDFLNSWNKYRDNEKNHYKDSIKDEIRSQEIMEGQLMLMNAKRFNVVLQIEEEFRKRLVQIYNEVKKRLDYQVALYDIERKIQHKNLLDWVVAEVRKSFNTEKDQQIINECIIMLKTIIAKEEKKNK